MTRKSGNVLWFILISIFLLGALTAFFSNIGNQTENTGDKERARIAASNILRDVKDVEAHVARLMSQGCSESQISFHDGNTWIDPTLIEREECYLFRLKGANLYPPAPKEGWLDGPHPSHVSDFQKYIYTGTYCVPDIGTGSGGICTESNKEIIMALPFLRKDVCLALNSILRISNPSGDAPAAAATVMPGNEYDGTFPAAAAFAADDAAFDGRKAGCAKNTSATPDFYVLYYVLLAR